MTAHELIEDDGVRKIRKNCERCTREFFITVPPLEDPDSPFAQAAWKLISYGTRNCPPCIDQIANDEFFESQARKLHDAQAAAGFPKMFERATFDEMDRTNGRDVVIDAAADWVREGGGLFLTSRPGTGKTRLAATAFRSMLRSRMGYWVNASVLFTQAQADFGSEWRDNAQKILLGAAPLVLDDLGKENPTQWARQHLQAALEERLMSGTHILVTSNNSAAELGAVYGDWLASRLAGHFKQYVMPGTDRRLTLIPGGLDDPRP